MEGHVTSYYAMLVLLYKEMFQTLKNQGFVVFGEQNILYSISVSN